MKVSKLYIVATLMLSTAVQAQISKEQEQFNQAVNYVNCKYVEYSLQKKCNCETQPEFDLIIKCVTNENVTLELAKEIDSLKSKYDSQTFDATRAIRFLTDSIFNDSKAYPKLYAFAKKRKDNDDFKELKDSIIDTLKKIFAVSNPVGDSSTTSDTAQRLNGDKGKDTIPSSSDGSEGKEIFSFRNFFLPIIISVIFSVILALLMVNLFFVRKNQLNKDDDSGQRSDEDKIQKKLGNLESAIRDWQNSRDDFSRRIGSLENDIKFLKTTIQNKSAPFEYNAPGNEAPVNPLDRQPEAKAEVFYLSTPNADGSFNVSSASPDYKEGASIYRFTKTNDNKATFTIDEREASIRLALQYLESNIERVCEAFNAYNPKARSIYTKTPGKAELIGDKWKVTAKAEITYES
ncbi:MAG: hypothetical protein SFW35_00530 [Chitinophagales bacterium]|nr:hypothetical protein [Chitinophagales bacterium]